MGLFKRFRKRQKPEEVGNVLETRNSGQQKGQGQEQKEKDSRHEALEYCEQMMAAARDLEETKQEYKIVTDYLTDIQVLEDLPDAERKALEETAKNVVQLNESRDAYLQKAKTISDAQFAQMEQMEDEIPDAIKRLKTNEAYQTAVKRDMQYLEGEKSQWLYYQESLEKERFILKRVLYVLLGAGTLGVILVVVLSRVLRFKLQLPFLAVILTAAAAAGIVLLRMQSDELQLKKAQANINRAITLLNKVKLKYVNVTNAVDYACEKYHVKNAYELNYFWEQYMDAVKEQNKYQQANEDLDYFNKKLIRDLSGYHLYDPRIWIYQAHALLDKKEMVEVKHDLLMRRKKLRSRMEEQIANIQNAKTEIHKMMKNYKQQENEIRNVLDSLDRMCGI